MTIERLRELNARATKPPWRDRSHALMRQWSKADKTEYRYVAFSGKGDEDYTTSPLNAADARLIAAMRNALPALLDVAEAAERDHEHATPIAKTQCSICAALAALDKLP